MTSSTDTTADYYRLLGVSPDATNEEIRAAYRAKLRLSHPDLVTDTSEDVRQAATEMTAQLNEAYECLSDPDRRTAYDVSSGSRDAEVDPPPRRSPTSSSRGRSKRVSGRRLRDLATISLGGVVLPLGMLAWASDILPAPAPANPSLVAAISAAVITATAWLLTSSRLFRRPAGLARIGVIWGHLMRWLGWAVLGGGIVLLGIPAAVLILTAVIATPFLGLVVIALISGRSDSQSR